jgi:hypothetical protein
MGNIFVEDDDIIEIKVYCRKKGHKYEAYTEKELKDPKNKIKEEDKSKFDCLLIKMKTLTWGLYNQLQEDAMTENAAGERLFNFKAYKENRLKKLIKEWDAKGKDGRVVPVNDLSISHLAPPIAESILRAYDEISFLGEDDEKN